MRLQEEKEGKVILLNQFTNVELNQSGSDVFELGVNQVYEIDVQETHLRGKVNFTCSSTENKDQVISYSFPRPIGGDLQGFDFINTIKKIFKRKALKVNQWKWDTRYLNLTLKNDINSNSYRNTQSSN